MPQLRLAREGAAGALELAFPAVRGGQRFGLVGVADGELRQRAQALALGRRLLELPGQLRERAPPRPAANVVRVEEHDDLVPERARLARAPLVGGGLTDEGQPPGGARAGGVEEVAVALDGVGPQEACARLPVELASRLVVEEGRGIAAARQRAFLKAEQEDVIEAAGSRPREVEDGDPATLARRPETHLGVLERAEDLVGREVATE